MAYKARTATCLECGHEFTGRFGPRRQFCSVLCRQLYRNAPERNPAKSPAARKKLSDTAKGNTKCAGREITQETRARIAKKLTGRALSADHRAAISVGVRKAGCVPPRNPHLVGPAHPGWKGGHSTVRQASWRTPQYVAFRAAVLERDGWTCQECGGKTGKLHVHHIKPWGPFPALRFSVSNGVSLCIPCHHAVHRGAPKPVTVGPRTLAEALESGPNE